MLEHKRWLDHAWDDLETARIVSEGERIIVSTGMFHTQQCAEKSLKAYLIYKREPLRLIHDLVAILNLCIRFDKDFEDLRLDVESLSPYLCNTRYPDDCFLMPDTAALQVSVKQAEKIYNFVYNKIHEMS